MTDTTTELLPRQDRRTTQGRRLELGRRHNCSIRAHTAGRLKRRLYASRSSRTTHGGYRGQTLEQGADHRPRPRHPPCHTSGCSLRLPHETANRYGCWTRTGTRMRERSPHFFRRKTWNAGFPRGRYGAGCPAFQLTKNSWIKATSIGLHFEAWRSEQLFNSVQISLKTLTMPLPW